MRCISLNLDNCSGFFNLKEFEKAVDKANEMIRVLSKGEGKGSDFTGWLNLPVEQDKGELGRIKKAAERIRESSDHVINIGIGGSYLGVKALDEALGLSENDTGLLYAGNSLSGREMAKLLKTIKDKDISLIAISKSGTTTEPAVAFRILRKHMMEKYGDKAGERIFVVTDSEKGALKSIAEKYGYERFTIPKDVGGRYSVLTPVGLLPLAAAGADIDKLIEGAAYARGLFFKDGMQNAQSGSKNICAEYAAARNMLFKQKKYIEIMAVYENSLRYFAEWWKQLFGESEGKEETGIFPASVVFTADLHSMGQYIQQGMRNIFETVVSIEENEEDMVIPETEDEGDGIGYLAGMNLNKVNRTATEATVKAHTAGGVPNIIINIPSVEEKYMGQLIYFFELSCAISGYMLGINPFDQPGVEAYKTEMFKMLGKPGY